MTRAELADRLASAAPPLVLDVRPAAEFVAGHVRGAVSLPPDVAEDRLARLSADSDIVAYCRGPFCVYADDAVRALGRRGCAPRRLEDGFPEWRRSGLPVAVGTDVSGEPS